MITLKNRPQFLVALRAYARWCRQHPGAHRQPEADWSAVGRRYVHLRDRIGPLARYDLVTEQLVLIPQRAE
jgi:hypothetical protein